MKIFRGIYAHRKKNGSRPHLKKHGNGCPGGWQALPAPCLPGRFPHILEEAVQEGFSRDHLLNTLDMWLNYGYCRIIDPITQDIELTEEGMRYFY